MMQQHLPAPYEVSNTSTERSERPLVLVIDNTAAIRDMLSYLLRLQGYQPVCKANGQEALEWIENALRIGQLPAVILLDLLMPVMNGSAFLERLRASWNAPFPIPPILLLTVQVGNHSHLKCDDVLFKPFHIKDLWERLDRLVNRSYSMVK